MQIPPKCFLLAALAIPAFADVIGFYGGDFDPSGNNLTNATTALINGSPTGISLYQAFVVPTGGWTVTELFSNNVMGFTPVSAYWEIRSGVSSGNGGTLLYSGTDTTPGLAATGRSLFQFPEWTVSVTGLSLALAPRYILGDRDTAGPHHERAFVYDGHLRSQRDRSGAARCCVHQLGYPQLELRKRQ
ncbi:MAG: hypothetical protein JST65_18740 [Acidobacteria bacterium]|nr:hypothetical protein [Acidobacteriota bacterium]